MGSINTTMDWTPAESHPGDHAHLKSGDLIEVGDKEEEQDRSPQRNEQHNAKKGRDDKKEDRKRRHNIANVHALQHRKGPSVSTSKPTAKRGREDNEDDETSDGQQDNTVNQRASKKNCGKAVKDRRVLSLAFFELVERGGGEIRYDIKEDPWGLSKNGTVAKISLEMSTKRFEDEMSMLDAAMGGTSFNQ
ncbi:uncharacterized protein EAE97_002710 [Botrytis byssoidea]|uniref:Uncharacterized protein n=1 Tax=Botrytis byssoidea TaxID=139641 RepID=A0A9P5IVZ5_9HELO|nr:uncharacterized protein EAE97_002710 [Botrytis byssoidea]KAF7951159.1 hypothetical protein EAE97_002710 [Botrytis byssoidea]